MDLESRVLYYPSSENKGADQLRGYRAADLRLCFRIYAERWFFHDAAQKCEVMTIFSCIFHIFSSFFFKHRLRVHILTRSDTNQAAQLLGMDRSLKFWI